MTTYTLFDHSTGGGVQGSGDPSNYTMGVEFYVTQSGCTLTKIHFYWATTGATTDHACRLYTSDVGGGTGTLVSGSSKAFPQPFTSNGWQTVTLDTPIALTANTRYRACVYFTTDNGYSATGAYWSTGPGSAGITNGPLKAPNAATTNGGIQDSFNNTADAFPAQSFNSANYWIDVTIDDGATPGITGAISGPLPGPTGTLAGNVIGTVTGFLFGGGTAVPDEGVPDEMVPDATGANYLPTLGGALVSVPPPPPVFDRWSSLLGAMRGVHGEAAQIAALPGVECPRCGYRLEPNVRAAGMLRCAFDGWTGSPREAVVVTAPRFGG